jgi:hypothetical protein
MKNSKSIVLKDKLYHSTYTMKNDSACFYSTHDALEIFLRSSTHVIKQKQLTEIQNRR